AMSATQKEAAVMPHGIDAVLIGEIGPILGVSPSLLYQAGSRGELALFRLGGKWAVDLAEVQSFVPRYLAERAAAAEAKAEKDVARQAELQRRVEAAAAEIRAGLATV